MISFPRTSSALSLIVAVALVGAGCAKSDTPSSTVVTPTPPTTTNPLPPPTPMPTSSAPTLPGSPSASTITASTTLDTTGWQTYQNKTLKFSFQSPLRGTFAPEYAVRILPLTSTEIEHDCIKPNGLPNAMEQRITVNGSAFCRTHTVEGAAGSSYDQDVWVTKTDKWYGIITFTKRYPNDPAKTFDTEGYHRQLETIMSTFQFPTAT